MGIPSQDIRDGTPSPSISLPSHFMRVRGYVDCNRQIRNSLHANHRKQNVYGRSTFPFWECTSSHVKKPGRIGSRADLSLFLFYRVEGNTRPTISALDLRRPNSCREPAAISQLHSQETETFPSLCAARHALMLCSGGGSSFQPQRRPYACFTNCRSRAMLTSSLTINPPASSAAFQVSPKSLRLIFVVAAKPMRVLPHGSFVAGDGPSTTNFTLRVTPLIVRSPVTTSSPSDFTAMCVDFNCIVGNCSTSKKSSAFRWASRPASSVWIDAISIAASTLDCVRSASSSDSVPATPVK